jgi:hypothetical protein
LKIIDYAGHGEGYGGIRMVLSKAVTDEQLKFVKRSNEYSTAETTFFLALSN